MISEALIRPLISTSLRLSTHLATHPSHAKSNIAFSPLSLHSLLGLLTAGSTGHTQQQLLSFLGSKNASELSRLHSHVSSVVLADGSASRGPMLRYVSGVWVDDGPFTTLKKSFREVAESVYKAETRPVPFRSAIRYVLGYGLPEECRKEINEWAKKNTAGRIKDLLALGLLRTDTRLVLGNAMYFKGTWVDQFKPRLTKRRTFHLIDGTRIETPFMSSSERQYISVYDGFKVLKMPYVHARDRRQFSFNIFLPDTSDGLLDLSTKLGSDPDFLNSHIPIQRVPVGDFRIPKFKITMECRFSDILKDLGLVLPFEMTGDFSAMVDSPEIGEYYVSEIVHKWFVGVNEKGTEAAAVSAAMMLGCALFREEQKPIDFVADRPFLFMIREDMTGVVLFAGQLLNPSLTA